MSEISVSHILDRYPADRTSSLAVLEDIQTECKYLPREALEEVAERLNMHLGEVYQIATFFTAFSLEPKGERVIKVCLGTACHVAGGARILDQLERDLGIKAGGTTPDGKCSLEAVRCVGACALSPLVLVDEEPHSKMTPDKASDLITKVLGAKEEGEGARTPAAELPSRAPVDLSRVPPTG
ncbi:MAG: NAD(P)H-dependent oxidoreductase subunit E [Anaerolineae bacterium]|nr:NAD(P)H-dependent oxidoreductase subunit E [Anaerolineae bacterium]